MASISALALTCSGPDGKTRPERPERPRAQSLFLAGMAIVMAATKLRAQAGRMSPENQHWPREIILTERKVW